MYDPELLVEKLKTLLEALERIPRRFAGIATPDDFYASDAGIDRMDAICMILIAVGEEFKNIDRKTEGNLLSRYPTSAHRLRSAQVRSGRRPASFVHRSK